MRKPDVRAVLTYSVLGAVGLFLLVLVTPNIWGPDALPWVTLLSALLPVVVLGALLVTAFGRSKQTTRPQSLRVSKALGCAAAGSIILSVLLTYISTRIDWATPSGRLRFVLENTGVAFLFIAYACTIVLMNRQKFLYWPFWNSNDKRGADERQRNVRLRVFERAYILNLVAALVLLLFAGNNSQRLHDELLQVGILCLLGLPTIIASWQKDS